jgi:enoyl-[acyl-carrier-protein] reductase (NADH)
MLQCKRLQEPGTYVLDSKTAPDPDPAAGKNNARGLVVGIANDKASPGAAPVPSAPPAPNWPSPGFNDKARPYVQPLAQQLEAIQLPLDVEQPGQLEAVFAAIAAQVGAA